MCSDPDLHGRHAVPENAPVQVDLRSDQSEQESLTWLARHALHLGGSPAEADGTGRTPEATVTLTVGEIRLLANLLDDVRLVVTPPDPRQVTRRSQTLANLLWEHLRH